MTIESPDPKSAISDINGLVLPAAIRDELARILASPEFHASEKRRKFLSFVVEETLAGRADQLKGYTVATTVFNRDKDFDPANDPVVRIQAGKLRRELERYYLVDGRTDPIRIDIPKGRYVPFFIEQSAGSPLAETKPHRHHPHADPSVAVLPLANLTESTDHGYFIDGLTSELTAELGRYQDIVAVPCNGTIPIPSTPAETKALASTLAVRFLLGGTLRKDDETTKVTFHLTDAASGQQVWTDTYKHALDAAGMIATQERVALDVVATIADELGIISQRLARESRKTPPSELTTYEAILRYHHYMQVLTPDAYESAFAALQVAVTREPEYGPAWSAFANLFNHAYIRDADGIPDPLQTATKYARKGAALQPESQLTRTIMAYVYLLRGEKESVLEEAGVALALNPNSSYFAGTLGYVLTVAGDFEQGRTLVDSAIARNPCHPGWFHHACWLDDFRRGDYEASYREAWKAGPQMGFWNPAMCVASLGQLGQVSEARAFVKELRRLKPDFEPRARELISRTLKIEDLAERIIQGLRSGGLEIE